MRTLTLSVALLALAGAGTGIADAKAPKLVTANVQAPDGLNVANATIKPVRSGLKVTVIAHNMAPGTHGVHIHTTGLCEAPGFVSAGGHWNPTNMHHGSMNPMGPHEGDLPNLVIGADGKGQVSYVIKHATLAALLDTDGAAVVIHAGPDDLMTDPAGNSGGRIACGVLG